MRKRRKLTALVSAFAMVVLIGFIDSITGPELSLSAFYLIPILISSYYAGFSAGIAVSCFSIIVYLIGDQFLSIQYEPSAIPYWNSGIRFVLFIAVVHIVAKRKLAEEKLSQSEERFRLLVEGAKEYAILMLDISGRIASWNAGSERTYGYSSREIIGQHFRILYPPSEANSRRPEHDLQQAREKGEISFECWRQKQDGSEFWAETIITPVKEKQRLRGFALITRDITERKNAEKTIQVFAKLHKVDRSILAANSSESIARAALEGLEELIPCNFATVTRFDLELGQTSFVAVKVAADMPAEINSFMLDAQDYEDLEHLESGNVQSVSDVHQDSRAPLRSVLPFAELRSYVIVPLLSQASFIGSLNFGSNEPQFFTQEHLEVAKEVANQMALALRNADLFEKLSLAHQRLQMLNQKMLQAQEMERHHLARELHDEVGQELTALRIHLEEIEAQIQNPFLSQRLTDSNAILERILNQIRNLSLDLRPLVLDDLGLVAALRWYASSRAQLAGFSIHFESDEKIEDLTAEIETVCFRVAQEAITNIVRHAEAKHVRLYLSAVNGEILLSVKDDGRGFDLQEAHDRSMNGESFGLLGMKERASLVGGDLEIESVPSCGTEIRMRLPFKKELQVRT